jgi:hypothetical protein
MMLPIDTRVAMPNTSYQLLELIHPLSKVCRILNSTSALHSHEGSNTLYWKRSVLTNRWGIFQSYKKDWVSWPDFLGYGEGKLPVGTFLVFEEAREVARAQEFSVAEEVRSHPFDSSLSKAVVK